ncbi:D-alanine--D-alanine ligase A, partial [Rhodococcus ruber]|nr:D-alanine--D-alanine ligase A [Rhodococcus ruber]
VLASVDVVFPYMHGAYGEDGTNHGLLELAGVPYVGPGVLASGAGMDKEFTKKLLAAEVLPVGFQVVLRPGT